MPKTTPASKTKTTVNRLDYVVAGTVAQGGERIVELLREPDPSLRPGVIGLIAAEPWSGFGARQFWCHLLFLGMCLGEPDDIPPLAELPNKPRPSQMLKWIAEMRTLAARVVSLRHGLRDGPTAPEGELPTSKAKLHDILKSHIGAANWDPTDALVDVLRQRKFARQGEEGLVIWATLLLNGNANKMSALGPLTAEVPALIPLLQAKGVRAPVKAPVVEELLERVYEEPSDDAPRFVYADWLLEKGDPRGEFINAQLRSAKEPKVTKQRKRNWLGPLRGLIRTDRPYRFRRGFVSGVTVADFEAGDTPRAWATVEVVDIVGKGNHLSAIPFSKLRAIGGIKSTFLDELHAAVPTLSAIGLKQVLKADEKTAWSSLQRFENLKHLFVSNLSPKALDSLCDSPLVGSLDTLMFQSGTSEGVLKRLPKKLRILTVGSWHDSMWLDDHKCGEYTRNGRKTTPVKDGPWNVLFPS